MVKADQHAASACMAGSSQKLYMTGTEERMKSVFNSKLIVPCFRLLSSIRWLVYIASAALPIGQNGYELLYALWAPYL